MVILEMILGVLTHYPPSPGVLGVPFQRIFVRISGLLAFPDVPGLSLCVSTQVLRIPSIHLKNENHGY